MDVNEVLLEKISSNQEVYFINTFEEKVFKSDANGYYAKEKGVKPYEVKIGNKSLTDAFLEGKIISKEEYDKF